jgi:class 3 adenylate cyclase/HAMP domain-containing protein/putative methionine-R-sulfoxide reductase with GAF domain
MKIYGKILLATLPLLLIAFIVAGGITFYLSRDALGVIAEQWLETRSLEALKSAQDQQEFLKAYALDTIETSVMQAQNDATGIMSTIEVGDEGHIMVVNGDGIVVLGPRPEVSGMNVSGEVWFTILSGEGAGRLEYGFQGVDYLGSYQYFEPWDWYVIATDPESEVYGAVNRLGSLVLVLGIVGTILIALVLMTLTRKVTSPLAELVDGANRVGAGDLDTTIPVRSVDEVGMLAKSFNEMTEQLKTLYNRLEERLTTVVSNAPIIVFSLDNDGRITLLEGKGLDFVSLDSERCAGQSMDTVFQGSDGIVDAAGSALDGNTVSTIAEFKGQIFEIWCTPLLTSTDTFNGVIGVATDVTERETAQKKLNNQAQYLTALNETTLGIVSRLEIEELLLAIVTRSGELFNAPHGFVYLLDVDGEEMERKVGIGVYNKSVGKKLKFGEGLAGRVWESGDGQVVNDYSNWEGRVSNVDNDGVIRSLICMPLVSGNQVNGVLGMAYDFNSEREFGEEEEAILLRFSELASISLDNAKLFDAVQKGKEQVLEHNRVLESVSKKLSKYLSPQVYASIFSGEQKVEISSRRKRLTVFFSDIAGFTEIADKMESEDLTKLLNHYLSEMTRIGLEFGATIDKYVGDAIVIFFGDPESRGVKEDALSCVKMAIAMRNRMTELQAAWRDDGIENPLHSRMGINTGYCTVGNFGSEDRMDYTIIGGGVNLASRLENKCKPGEILVSYETYAHIKDDVLCEPWGEISVKGIAYPVSTYRILDLKQNLDSSIESISEKGPNLSIDIDTGSMTREQRERARDSLQRALDTIDRISERE